MLKKILISFVFILTSVAICNENLPIVQFDVQIFNNDEVVQKLAPEYYNYIKYEADEIPAKIINSYSKPAIDCNPFYNSMQEAQESFFSLSNVRLIEGLLAQGYHLRSYLWLVREEQKPFSSVVCTLIGYDREEQMFVGQLSNGKETTFSYEYASKNLRFVEIANNSNLSRKWQWTLFPDEESSDLQIQRIVIEGSTFEQVCHQLMEKIDNQKMDCFAHIIPNITKNFREQEVSVPFRMEIKKKQVSSKGCGGYYWWPVGSKEWDTIRWDEEKNGRILYLDPTRPLDYPKYPSSNYFHNTNVKCHPCGFSKMVPGVWINVRIEGNTISTKIVKKSTCNIGHGYLDKYGNSTAVVAGIVNIWVEK